MIEHSVHISDAEAKVWPWVFARVKRVCVEAMRKTVRKQNRITKPKNKGLRFFGARNRYDVFHVFFGFAI